MRRLLFYLCVVLLPINFSAQAYVLPATFLMRMLAAKRVDQKIKDLSIQFNSENVASNTSIDKHLYLKQPRRLRLVEEGEESHVHVEREGLCGEGRADRVSRKKCAPRDLLATLFVPGQRDYDALQENMVAALKRSGIDTDLVTLGRDAHQRFIYIIGARSWEDDKPQLWLSKETYLPLRLRTQDQNGSYEIRFLDYGSQVAGNWFPATWEEYRDDKLQQRSEITKIKINQSLPESMFDIVK